MRQLWLCTLLLPSLALAEVYRWTDANGRVHFGERPQAGAVQVEVKPQVIQRDIQRQHVALRAGNRRFLRRHRRHQWAELRLPALPLHHHQQDFGHILREFPTTDAAAETTYQARQGVHRVLHGADGRLVVVVGPCSIHDVRAARECLVRNQTAPQARMRLESSENSAIGFIAEV